ncbi:hypothetical protein CTI12_AA256940 [Artemisia annua]|uniref:Uncharacterized protein n=1 Tax=Artemisia annua TaxID=35608 RepID=A0A2U1NKD5_ARTAN|nr:hypothetical protein CTI12_AA256940 [Artemisia annua]
MGGGAVIPTPAATSNAMNYHFLPPRSSFFSRFASGLWTESYEYMHESGEISNGYYNESTNLVSVPSQLEVLNAMSDFQRVMNGFSAPTVEVRGLGLIMEQRPMCDSSRIITKSLHQKRLLDAYHLLQTDHSVQRLVLSLSSDTRVWNAILVNDAVQDLQGRPMPHAATATAGMATSYRHQLESTSVIVEWICGFMKSKLVDLIDKLEIFVLKALQSLTEESTPTLTLDNMLEEKLRSSLLLSVVILLIVVVTRSMER